MSLIELLIGSLVELGGREIEYDATVRKAEDTIGIGLSEVRLVQAADDRNAFRPCYLLKQGHDAAR